MSINPQFIYGADGLPTNAVIPYEAWQELMARGLLEAPEWIVSESKRRLENYRIDPGSAKLADVFFDALAKDDCENNSATE